MLVSDVIAAIDERLAPLVRRLSDLEATQQILTNRLLEIERRMRAAGSDDGIKYDLESALRVLARRINGEKDLASAADWLEANYPDFAQEHLNNRDVATANAKQVQMEEKIARILAPDVWVKIIEKNVPLERLTLSEQKAAEDSLEKAAKVATLLLEEIDSN